MPLIRIQERPEEPDGSNAIVSFNNGPEYPITINDPFKEQESKSLNGTSKNTWNSLSLKKYVLKTQPPALKPMARNFSNKFLAIQISMPSIATC